ncbi:MAG: YkgJ family cysteine cluster protein [Deltaproteobacteria bacterium]|nr:YkgJ family cysteine cluster protein [Deltaproteobacteria bacterium]
MSHEPDQLWFHAGLRFECTRCGRCCRGPGNVWVSDLGIEALAGATASEVDEFRKTFVRRSGRRGPVLAQKRNQDCIFWDDSGGCQVYTSRPRQCRTYPFWKANLQTEPAWNAERRSCPGIGEGSLHGREIIASMLADDGIPDHRTRSRKR